MILPLCFFTLPTLLGLLRSSTSAKYKTDFLWALQSPLSLCCLSVPECFPWPAMLTGLQVSLPNSPDLCLFILLPFWQMLHMLCCTSSVVPHDKRRPVLLAVPGAAAIPGGYTTMNTESRCVSDPEFRLAIGLCWALTRQLWSSQGVTSLHVKPATLFSLCLWEEFLSWGSPLLDFL